MTLQRPLLVAAVTAMAKQTTGILVVGLILGNLSYFGYPAFEYAAQPYDSLYRCELQVLAHQGAICGVMGNRVPQKTRNFSE